jgi:TatD DNase family protein
MKNIDQIYIDIHTHSPASSGNPIQIINLFPEQSMIPLAAHSFYSVGWHPWFLKEELVDEYLYIVSIASQRQEVLAVGECGLDHLSKVPFPLQKEVFRQQALIAERVGKPLLIHCVRASNEVIRIKKELKPKVPWIIHGFNSNLITGRALLRNDFYLSLGVDLLKDFSNARKFLPEIPLDRLFFETGDMEIAIEEIYQIGAMKLNMSALIMQIELNFNKVFYAEGIITHFKNK